MNKADAVIIGSGPAGLAVAVSLKEAGVEDLLIVEREDFLGGVLMQCIHNGFGLHKFHSELTGPEYAERYIQLIKKYDISFLTKTCAIDILEKQEQRKSVVLLSAEKGLIKIDTKAVVLSMGCRERNRGNISIPGSRPAGIMTAGFAQRLVNIEGYLPGKEVVVLGSGDIGLIMARRLTWEGANVKAVIEINRYPGGLNRNVVQCLSDFNIPLYLSHAVTKIEGGKRIKAVEVTPLDIGGNQLPNDRFTLPCDTLLLSVGLIPENELSIKAGISIDPITNGPVVDGGLMTSVPGIFACGNVLHVHDLVDWVSEEADRCGKTAALHIEGKLKKKRELQIKAGNFLRYILPGKVEVDKPALLSLRSVAPLENVVLNVKAGPDIIYKKKFVKVFPSEMIRICLENVPDLGDDLEVYFNLENK